MRKIVQGSGDHNTRGLVLLLAAAVLAAVTGCQTTGEDSSAPPCPVTVDAAAWTAFDDMATRMLAGSPVPDTEIEAYCDLAATNLWRRSLAPHSPSTINLANWLDSAFGDGEQAKGKYSSDRKTMVKNFRYSYGHRELIGDFIAEFERNQACQLDSLVQYWFDPGNRPPHPVTVHFLPTKAEIRIKNDSLIVDTGILVAMGPDQLTRQLASLLYRNHQVIEGDNPTELEGAASLAHSWRLLTNQAITTWIEHLTATEFRSDHPRLGDVSVIPENIFISAIKAVEQVNVQLAAIRTDPTLADQRGLFLTNWFMGQNAYMNLGYGMAATIVGHLGVERLREEADSVPGLLAAYQEAALLNPLPYPRPGDAGQNIYHSMPPLEPDVYQGLHAFLMEAFPQ